MRFFNTYIKCLAQNAQDIALKGIIISEFCAVINCKVLGGCHNIHIQLMCSCCTHKREDKELFLTVTPGCA